MIYDEQTAATALAALGHEARLRIFRLLVRAGDEGLSVGEIGTHLGVPASTLAHHLSALVTAGLVIQERQGRIIRNRIDSSACAAFWPICPTNAAPVSSPRRPT